MSGVVIDVAAESKSAQEQLRDINRHLAEIVRNTNLSNSALGGLRTDNLKHLSKETKQTAKNFKIVENSAKTSFSNIEGSVKRSGSSLSSLKSLVLTVASSFLALKGISIFNRAADDLTRVQNRLKLVEKDFNSLLITQNKLYSISQATASSLSDTANVYTSFKRALEDKGLGESTLLNVTKTIQQASALSGSSIEGIQGAILQLNQGISSGTLRGEELNSVLEQLPYLGIELQRGLGMSAGALRKFAEEGKLTTELLLNVIKNMRGKTESDFSKITFTVEMAFNNLISTLSYFTGALNKFFGSSEGFSKRLFLFSRSIERFAVDTEIAFFTAIRMLDNFKNRLDNFTAIEMTLDVLWALKINPFQVIDSYSFYKEMQGIKVVIDKYLYDVKKKGFMESKIDFEIIANILSGEASAKAYKEKFEAQKALDREAAKNKKLSLKETIFGAGNQTIESSNLFVEKLAQSGKLFFEIFKSVYLVIKDVSYVIKAYAIPPFALMDKALIMIAARTKSFVTSTIDSYYKVANAAEVLQEAVNPFVIGKNIERAFVDIFRANGIDDLTLRIRNFNNELKAGPNNNYWAELSKFFKPTSGISKVIYDTGRALGFFNYNLYSSATISKKVVDIGLNVITNSFRRLYDQILLPRFGPALVQLILVIRGYLRQISRLFIGSFNAEYGKFFAEKIIEGFKLVLEYSKKFFVELFRTLTEVGNNQNKNGILSLFKNIFVNLFEFIVSFGFTIIRELYTQTVNLFLNLGNAIRNSINAFEELLTFNIKLNINEEAGKNVARTLINIIKSFSNLFEPLIDNLRSLIDNALSMTTVNTAVSLKLQLLNIFVLLFRTIGQFLKGFAKEIGNALISQLLIVFKNLLEYFSKFTTYIREKITGIFEYLSNSFDKIKEKFSSTFEKLDTNVSLDIDLTVPKEKFNDLKEGILDINLEETSGKFYNFKNELLSYFAELYDKIIGNSYWTDFIDNVEDAPKKLESTEGFFKSFSTRIVDNFKSIYNNTRIFLNSFYSKIKTSVINNFQFISQAVLDKIRLALFIGFTYIFSGEGLRKVIKGGFAIFIIEAFASEFPELSKDIAILLSKSLEESLTLVTEALIFKIQGIIQQLPSLINAIIAGLPPAFSIIDYLIPDNTLLYAAFAGVLIYLAKAEDAVTNLKTVFLGSFEKIKGGGEKLVEAGFLQYIQDFWFQLQTALGRVPVPSKISFANPKIFAVGILASLTALSDSISGLEAAVVGIPLLVYGAIGKAAGNRAFISLLSVMFVKPILIALSVSEAFLRKELSAKNPFLKIFDFTNWIKDAITGKGVKKETLLSRIKDNLTGVLENITKNRERYGLRQISLFELLFDTSFKDSILNRKASAFGFKQNNKTAFFEDLVAKASDLKDAFKKSLEPLRANISLFWEAFKINATDAIGKSRRALRSFSDTLRNFLSTSFGKQTAIGLALLTITIFFSEAQAASSNTSKVIKSNFTEIITAITGLISAIGVIALTYKSLLLLITNPRKVVAGFSAIKSIIVGTFLEISSYFGKLNRENLRAISKSRAAWASLFTFLFKGYRSIFTVSAAIFGVASLQSFSDGLEGIGNTLGNTTAALSSFIIALTTAATLYRGIKAFRRGKKEFSDGIKADFKKQYFEDVKNGSPNGSPNPFSFEKTIEQRAKKPFGSTISGFRAVSNEFSDLGTAVRKSFIDAFAPFGKAADIFSEKWGKGSKTSAILAWLLTLFWEISKMPFKIVYNILAVIPVVDALLFAITAPFSALKKGFIAVKNNYKDLTIDTDKLKTKMIALGIAIKAAFLPLAFSAKLLLGIAAIAIVGVGIFAGILFGAKGEVGFKVTFNYWFDRIKMLLGMQASSAKGRLYELSSKLRSREIGGNTLDIVKTLVKVDFDKIDKYRYSALSKAADEAADTFNRLEELAIRQGGLTAAQQDEYNKTRSGLISTFNKQPQLNLEMDSYQAAISDMLTDVDNTLLSRIKRFVGLGPVVDANSVSNVRQAVDFIKRGATTISNGLQDAAKVAAEWGGKAWEIAKWVIFPIKLLEWGWAGILGSLEWIGNKLNEFAEWFGRKTEQKPTKENLIVRDYFVELLKPLVKNKAFLTDLEINTIEQYQEDLLTAITEKNTSQQKGLTDAEYSLPGGRDIYNKRINDLEDNIRDLFDKFEKYVIDTSYNAALKSKAQEITQYLTDASLQVKDAFDMTDLGDAFEKSSLNLEESLQLERKADAFKVVGKRIKEAQSERERFYYYARSQNLVAEAKAIEELSKKFGTLKGELEGLTEFSNIFGNIFGSVTRNADREGFDKIIELIKEISSFDISMENYRSGSINYEQESIDYEIEYRKKKLKELQALFLKIPTPDILSVNETLKTLDIKPLDLKVNISDKELEALKQLFIEYAFQVKAANDLKLSPEVRLEVLQNSTKTLERIKIISAEINLSKVFSVDNNIVSKLDYIKTIFETEIPNALIASKEALNNWINIKGKLEDTKNKISQAYLKQDYDGLKTATEDLQKLELGMKIIEESVNPNALNEALSSLNLEIPQENTKKLSENIKEFITKASILANAETTTVEQKLVIEATIKDIIFKENLPTEISSMDTLDKVFSKLNIDTSIIGNYSEENIKNFEKLYDSYNRLEYAQDKFLKQKDYKNFIKARQLIQDIDKNVEALGKTLLDTKSKITEVFNIEIDDRTLFELSSVLRKQISDAAKYFEDGFKKISEGATVVGGKTISMFFDEFENYKNSSKILTFISKISTQSREILKGGIKNAYEQLNKYIPKLKIDTFLEIPGNLGRELANRLARNDTLKEFILEVNLDEKQLKRINELLSTNLSGEKILKELKFEFPELKTDAEKSTEDLLNSTRELTEGLAAEKDAVKTLEESIRKLTEAVYIVSPLNTQNYSPIPKKNFKERSPDELFPLPEKAIAQGYLKIIESLDKIILSGFENSFQQFEETFRAIKDQEAYLQDSNEKLEFLLIGNEYSNRIITPNEYKPENIPKQFETTFAPLTEIYKRIKEKEIELSKIENSFVGNLERNLVEDQIAGLKRTFEKITEGIREGIYADIERVKDNKIEIEDLQGNFAENLSKYLSTEFALGENRLENRLLEALEAGYSPELSAIKAIDFEAMGARTDVLRERLTNFKESLYNPNILLELKRLLETPTIKDNPTEIRYIQGLIDSISKKLNPEGLLEPTEKIAQNTSNMLEKLDSIKNAILGNKNPLASNIVPSTSTQISSTTSATATPFYSFETPVFPEDISIRSEDIANLYMPVEESFNTIARNITENALNNANKITTAYRDETFELAGLLREIRDNVRPTFEFRPEPEGVPKEANALQAATGGYISGLGTGTSDSIPAMLSNGEFVVNAKAATNNRSILEAINNGYKLPGFASGGSISDKSNEVTKNDLFKRQLKFSEMSLIDAFSELYVAQGALRDKYPEFEFGMAFSGYPPLMALGAAMGVESIVRHLVNGFDDLEDASYNIIEDLAAGGLTKQTYDSLKAIINTSGALGGSRAGIVMGLATGSFAAKAYEDHKDEPVYNNFVKSLEKVRNIILDRLGFYFDTNDVMATPEQLRNNAALHLILNNSNLSLSELSKQLPEFINILATATGKSEQQIQNEIADFQKMYYTGSDLDGLPFGELVNSIKLLNNSILLKGLSSIKYKMASGGKIYGPGTGTSDSIPAMLSNGEYVINAKASKKYGAILHAINSGMELPGFKNGRTDAVRYIDPSLVHIALTKLVNELGMQTTAINALMQTIAVESSFFLDAKNRDSEASGLIQFTKETAKKLGTDVAAIRKMTLDEQMELIKKYLERLGSKSKQIKDREDMYMAIFAPSGIGKSDDFVLYSKDKSGLEYTQNKKAYDIDDNGEITRGEALSAIRKQKDYVNPVTENSTNSAINDNLRKLESQNFKAIYVALNSFTDINERLKYKFDELGVSLEESLIQTLPDNTKKIFDELTNKVLAANIVVKETSSKDILAYKKAQTAAREAREELNKFAENLQYITQKGKEFNDNFFDGLKTSLTELIKGTESTGKIWENLLDSISNSVINTFLDGLFKPFKDENVIGKLGESISSQGLGLGGNFLSMFGTKTKQTNSDQEETSIFDFFKNLFASKTESTGTAKASSGEYYTDDWGVGSVATTGLQQAVSQPMAAMQGAMSNTCGCIQQALAQNSMGAATNTAVSQNVVANNASWASPESYAMEAIPKESQEALATVGTEAAKPIAEGFTDGVETINTGVTTGFTSMMQGLQGIIGGGANMIISIFSSMIQIIQSIIKIMAMADGGYVSGPGTSTSDSIPAMLSNGEYVINAKATKQYAPLLDAINNGRFSKIAKGFATGGLVGSTVIATPAYSDISSQKGSSQQVVNINITGDISRQTKAEIYRMIPEITSGVNTVNKSRNYRG